MENRNLITSNSVQIQTVSDWRIYMRVPATLGAGKIAFEPNRVGELPEAVLASAFLLAKIGDPNGARERLNSLQMMIGSDSSDVASLAGVECPHSVVHDKC